MDASLAGRVEKLAEEIAGEAQTQDDLNGLMRLMMKSTLQRMLNTELEVHWGHRAGSAEEGSEASSAEGSDGDRKPAQTAGHRRNGYSQKTVKGDIGNLALDIPRDRNATFEPQVIPKHQRRIPGFDEKILVLYAKGMTTRDIQDVLTFHIDSLAVSRSNARHFLGIIYYPARKRRRVPLRAAQRMVLDLPC